MSIVVNGSRRNQAALTLAVDANTAHVVRALRRDGIEPILLKGPVLSRLLYQDGELRPYCDIDLLVAPDEMGRAEAALTALGYAPGPTPLPPQLPTATSWEHPRRTSVDLHRGLHFVGAPPHQLWDVVRRDATAIDVAGTPVLAPGLGVVAMHLSLHAARSGDVVPKTVDDLERGLATLPRAAWDDALVVATELGAVDALADGLALCPAGLRLAGELDLPSGGTKAMRLRSATTAYARPWTFELLIRQPSVGAALTAVLRHCFPPPAHLLPVSEHRRPGRLALAYAMHVAGTAAKLPGSLVAWARVSTATTAARSPRASASGEQEEAVYRASRWRRAGSRSG